MAGAAGATSTAWKTCSEAMFVLEALGVSSFTKKSKTLTAGSAAGCCGGAARGGDGACGGASTMVMTPLSTSGASSTYALRERDSDGRCES